MSSMGTVLSSSDVVNTPSLPEGTLSTLKLYHRLLSDEAMANNDVTTKASAEKLAMVFEQHKQTVLNEFSRQIAILEKAKSDAESIQSPLPVQDEQAAPIKNLTPARAAPRPPATTARVKNAVRNREVDILLSAAHDGGVADVHRQRKKPEVVLPGASVVKPAAAVRVKPPATRSRSRSGNRSLPLRIGTKPAAKPARKRPAKEAVEPVVDAVPDDSDSDSGDSSGDGQVEEKEEEEVVVVDEGSLRKRAKADEATPAEMAKLVPVQAAAEPVRAERRVTMCWYCTKTAANIHCHHDDCQQCICNNCFSLAVAETKKPPMCANH